MFGFSLSKLLVLAVIVAAVWYGFKMLGRKTGGGEAKKAAPRGRTKAVDAEDLVRCPVCETYVQPAAGPCERADCPRTL